MNRFLYRASFFFASLLLLATCAEGPERNIDYEIYSTHTTLEMLEGEEFQVTASPSTQTFNWQTTDAAVATVSSTGLVRAINDGTCFINITSSEGLSRSIPVDVVKLIALEGIEVLNSETFINIDSIVILNGKSIELTAASLPSVYNERIPFNIIWESSDEDIVTVDKDGVVKTVGFGNVEITASVEGKPSVYSVIPVEVLENPITSIQLESSLVLTLNTKHTVTPVFRPLDYGVRDASLVWESSDESVVKVTDGELDPVGLGSATITVSLKTDPLISAEMDILVASNPGILDRSDWEIVEWNSCICEEPQYAGLNRTPEKMLDGNAGTFWGSKWDAPKPLPYYFIFDMKSEHQVYSISITKPNDTWRGNLKNGYVEFSTDNVTWTKISDWSIESNVPRNHSFIQDGSSARYIRFVITDVFTYSRPDQGPSGGAQCDIAEFNVLGEE